MAAIPWLLSPRASLLVLCFAVLPYINSLHGAIVYDDKVAVLGNPDVQFHDLPLSQLFLHDFWGNAMNISLPTWLGVNISVQTSPWTHNSYRPLTVMTIRWNHWIGRSDTFIYHVTNVAIHAFACAAAYYTLVCVVGRTRRLQASIAAVLFACHPVHTEVVTNITSRAETLCAVFALAAIGFYLHVTNPRARHSKPGAIGSAIAIVSAFALVIVATLCKETALVVPAMIAALDVVCNTPDDEEFTDSSTSDSWLANVAAYVLHILRRVNWPRVITLLTLQVLLLYVRVAILSSG